MIRTKSRLWRWVLLGIPIYILNYILFNIVLWLTGSITLAYWSWPLAAPFTLEIWDVLEKGVKSNE